MSRRDKMLLERRKKRRASILAKYPSAVPLKAWRIESAQRLGLKEGTFNNRLYRGKIPYPKVKALNQREIYVIS